MRKNYNFFTYSFFFVTWLLTTTSAIANERILALAPHICETLYAIGAGQDVVGSVSYCDYPEAAKKLPRVGAYNRINVEAAMALKPTMAIVMNIQTPGIKLLETLGVKIVQSYPQKVDEVIADIRRLGKRTGHEQQATTLADDLQQRLDKLQRQQTKTPVFYEIWADPLLTAGQHTFIDDVLTQLGLFNVFGDVALEAPRVNVEAVIAAKPQLIIVPSENRDLKKRTAFWHKWLGEDIQVITVNPDLVHRPGPRLLDGMEYLQEQLNVKH
ncbi:helical backbone metal receptor [Ghiorsea bivora]|uniref:helical backbone metal receptor n=1 Tax=Ghiorsea bivora TaxID=1485545 RepID=UPI001E344B48|nr:helical backbone metal receptor [Ghiorsea bivora]